MAVHALGALLTRAIKPKFDPVSIRKLVVICLDYHSPDFAAELAKAILEAIPIAYQSMVLDVSERLGSRMALGYVEEAFSDRLGNADIPRFVQKGSRLFAYLEAELKRSKAVGHLGVVKSFRLGLINYETVVFVVRDLADPAASVDQYGAMRGLLVQRLVAAGAGGATMAAHVAANTLRSTPTSLRAKLLDRMRSTIARGLTNLYEPTLSDEDRAVGKDLLLERIATAAPHELNALLNQVPDHVAVIEEAGAKPQFCAPLARNPGFRAATERLPLRMAQQLHI